MSYFFITIELYIDLIVYTLFLIGFLFIKIKAYLNSKEELDFDTKYMYDKDFKTFFKLDEFKEFKNYCEFKTLDNSTLEIPIISKETLKSIVFFVTVPSNASVSLIQDKKEFLMIKEGYWLGIKEYLKQSKEGNLSAKIIADNESVKYLIIKKEVIE